MTHTETPGRSGISAQFLSLPLGGNFPLPSGGGLSKPCFERCCCGWMRPSRADGVCYPEGCTPDSIALSAASGQGSSGMIQRSKSKALLERRNAYEMAALNPYTAASASQAPHESTWSLSNRMHTASGAVRSGGVV